MLFTVELTLLEDMQIKDQNMEKPDIWNFAGLLKVNSIQGGGTIPLTEKKFVKKTANAINMIFY